MKPLWHAITVLVILSLLGLSIWAWVAAPCSWYAYSHVKDIPGRCIIMSKQ